MSKSFRRSNDDWDEDIVEKERRLLERKEKRSRKMSDRDPEKDDTDE